MTIIIGGIIEFLGMLPLTQAIIILRITIAMIVLIDRTTTKTIVGMDRLDIRIVVLEDIGILRDQIPVDEIPMDTIPTEDMNQIRSYF